MHLRIQPEQLEMLVRALRRNEYEARDVLVQLDQLNRSLDAHWSGAASAAFRRAYGGWSGAQNRRVDDLIRVAQHLQQVADGYRALERRLAQVELFSAATGGRSPGHARLTRQQVGPEPGPAPEPPGVVSVRTGWVQKQTGVGYSTWSSKTMLPGMQQPEIFVGIPSTIDLGVYKFAVPPEYQYALVDGQVETRFVYVWGRWENRETTVTSDGHARTITERVIERRPGYVMQQYQEVRLIDPRGNVLMVNRSGPLLDGPPGTLPQAP